MAARAQSKPDEGPGTNAGVGWRARGWRIEFRDGWARFAGHRHKRTEEGPSYFDDEIVPTEIPEEA